MVRRTIDTAIFECFEASPHTEAVIGCKANLLRTFPAHGVAIPISIFQDPRFRKEVALTLEKLDAEVIDEVLPISKKAGTEVIESRDTAHPKMVTEMFMATLAAVGQPVKVRQIRKRTRDDVLWDDCLSPWRRSPLWLSIRVAIQTILTYMLPEDEVRATLLYKNFMAFLMTEVASLASIAKLPGHLCLVINAKVARRVFKLGADVANFVSGRAHLISQETRKEQDDVWSAVQVQDSKRAAILTMDLPVQSDTSLTLHSSRNYLDSILIADQGPIQNSAGFTPQYKIWLTEDYRGLPNADCFSAINEELVYVLAEFENWVAKSLPVWVSQAYTRPHNDACVAIASLAKDYYARALSTYEDAPEQNSILVLTLAELWQAVDILAIRLLPLLKDFSPEIPLDFFYPILAPQCEQMQRLVKIEAYITRRNQQAKRRNPRIFDDRKEQSFAVQFSENSTEHKQLRRKIEEQASKEEASKKQEHVEKTTEFRQMQQDARRLTHEIKTSETGYQSDDPNCRKCRLERSMRAMSIGIYEWPLPENEAACIAAVFELDCPTSYVAWRSFTWLIVNDLGGPPMISISNPTATLLEYAGLHAHAKRKNSRLIFASKKKSFTKAHYKELKLPVPVERCLVSNALAYELFDAEKRAWVHPQVTTVPSIRSLCDTALPKGPYSNLQYAVDSTNHTQNRVIADQDTCARDLSLHEFLAFGSLRADGECLQWLNIKRELSASSLNLNAEEVSTLLTQAAWQAGSKGAKFMNQSRVGDEGLVDEIHGGTLSVVTPDQKSTLRLSHGEFLDFGFCTELMSTVSDNLDSVQANWNSDHALSLLIIITLRTLTLSTEPVIIDCAVKILRRIREVAEKWVHDLVEVLHEVYEDKQISRTQRRIVKAAILCKMTYNVDKKYVSEVLQSTDDLRCWVICSVRLCENTPGDSTALSPELRRLLFRDQRLSHALRQVVRRLIIDEGNTGADSAIGQILTGFESKTTSWTSLAYPQHRWIHMKTQASSTQTSQNIHYNILEGELIIDGMPLGRLPKNYVCTDLYKRIFGAKILHVSSADMLGMGFMTARSVHEYTVYFGMREDRLVIRTRKGQEVLELVPSENFIGDLPNSFVDDYTHWFDLYSTEIEFRPIDLPWKSSMDNWRLQYQVGLDFAPRLSKGERRLIDVRSRSFTAVMEVFGCLESAQFVHVTLHKEIKLEVFLPRLKLNFFLNQAGELQCQELRKIVDCDQSLGTLIGLKSRLVLCGLGDLAKKHDRIIIIPYGEPTVGRFGAHVEVKIVTSGKNVKFFNYRHDVELQRLIGDGKMSSALYKASLHALTSYIYPDPFTGYSGTDEALNCLSEQLTRCSEPLDEESIRLVKSLAELTPTRAYYPKHLKVMQQVLWHSTLSPLAQHDDFCQLAQKIIASGNRFSIFHPVSKTASLESSSDWSLLERARIRNSTYRSPDSGGNCLSREDDLEYEARDRSIIGPRVTKTYNTASLVAKWPSRMDVSGNIAADLEWMGTITGFGKAYHSASPVSELLELSFASSWGPLQALCRSSSRNDKYRLMFLFSTIAYSEKVSDLEGLRTLLAFALIPELREVRLPTHSSFTLSIGCIPTTEKLREILEYHKMTFRAPRRTSRIEGHRLQAVYVEKTKQQADTLVHHYKRQWPRSNPNASTAELSNLLNVEVAHSKISALFLECTKNVGFTSYLQQVQTILSNVQQASTLLEELPSQWQSFEQIPVLLQDRNCTLPTIESLMVEGPPELMPLVGVLTAERPSFGAARSMSLQSVIEAICSNGGNLSQGSIRRLYGNDLMASLHAYQDYQESSIPQDLPYSNAITVFHRIMVQHHVDEMSRQIHARLLSNSTSSQLLQLAEFWPRITFRSLLKLLSKTSTSTISTTWRNCLLTFGEAVTMLQRARRLVLAGEQLDASAFFDEIENVGRQGWNSSNLPEWLLIEIENDFLIRPIQARVALEMIQPSSSKNSLIQLNMGEGKSSVIIPLVAVALANGTKMVRIIVLKSLSKQMSQIMNRRLGGLVNRKIFYMPFSRKTTVDQGVVGQIEIMLKDCMSGKGVLLAHPEHILSFKLMGIERLTFGDYKLASRLLALQKWLEDNSRDILDESDEILDVRFQLIYTLGTQRMMDGLPERWQLAQQVFDLVDEHTSILQTTTVDQIELERRSPLSFPTVRLLSTGVGDVLMSLLAHDVVDSQLPGLNLTDCSLRVKEAISRFIQEYHVVEEDCLTIKRFFASDQVAIKKLLLIRGLIAHRILLFVFRDKRWSVNYGLHPTRCLSAVPYRAKGVPAPNAEFGHPDVAVALTCLTYYYSGLTDPQMRTCFELLYKSDDPTVEYATWTKRCVSLPESLLDWRAINLEDEHQCYDVLFPALRFSKKLADYFLNSVVFPQEGKEFDEKLSTSGWDIPSRPGAENISTGFSGTNDNRFLLPLTISQQDLPELQHTSGKVLDYVTRPENLRYYCARDENGQQMSAEHLLQYISNVEPHIRVLIDVGAQVLDKCNQDVVKDWMQLNTDADAGVFFDEEDNIMVLARGFEAESLATSSFQGRMDHCVVYLDEVHTRGTDLKLPKDARAAVTLGPRLTKDKLVQGMYLAC